MRILWWQEGFWPRVGGVQSVAEPMLRRLRARGHGIGVVTSQDSPDLPRADEWEGIPVWRFPFWQALSSGSVDAIAALRREIDARAAEPAADLVHMHGFGPSALFHQESARARRAPLVVALHSSNTLSDGSTTLFRQTLESAAWVTACSQSLLDAARTAVPSIAARAVVVLNGVEAPALAPAALPAEPRVLCLGHLAPHKGFDLVVRALPPLLSRFPSLRLIVAGEGPARAEWERLAARLGVAGAIDFVGTVRHADVPRLMNRASLVAVPSRRETFGLAAVEAALMARPVVAARVGGLPEVIADGETGLLVEPENSAALAAAIAALLASPTTAERLGAEGRHRALGRFSPDRQAGTYEEIHRRVMEARAQAAVTGTASESRAERACK